ncbi:peptidoglycan-binding protein [Streptomyces sp. NPDC057101]|uniref:peptidoglycan-binding domain-containing protein n=1 Tax=Streptomyces sp. NPDC057101 TaxID=3346020 RepID=UPI003629EA07
MCCGEKLVVDQDFGSATEAALRRAQQKAGTTVDGDYGPLTGKAIKHKPVSGSTCVRVP